MFSSPLSQLADHFGSDKGSVHGDRHRFAQIYDLVLKDRRDSVRKVAELGLARGPHENPAAAVRIGATAPSMAMWRAYFPQAQLYGFDIADFSALAATPPGFAFLQGDGGSVNDLQAFARLIGSDVDLIVDDASHASYHQQLALRELFPTLRSGGYYIVEDLHFQPPELEWSLPLVHKTAEWLEALRQGQGLLSPLWSEEQLRRFADQLALAVVFTHTAAAGSRFASATAILCKR